MSNSLALPRARTKRRRRKPPTPLERFLILVTAANLICIGVAVANLAVGDLKWGLSFLLNAGAVALNWPRAWAAFKRYVWGEDE